MKRGTLKRHEAAMAKLNRVQFHDGDFKKSGDSAVFSPICVEVAQRNGIIAVRDSKDKSIAPLRFTGEEWKAFVNGVKRGDFDAQP